jgi:hypothetical protein
VKRPEKTAPDHALTGMEGRLVLAAQHGRKGGGDLERRQLTLLARVGVLAAAFLLAAPAAAAATSGDGFRIETTTLRPSADAFVNARHPNRNSGSSRKLGADGRPHIHSYLRFRSRLENATLKSARLGLYVRRGGSHRFSVARTSNHWRESRITWRNRPNAHRPLRHGRARRGRWVWVDVSALVRSGHPTSLRLATGGRRRLLFASRKTRLAPKLRLTYEVEETAPADDECFGAPADYVQAFDATDGVVDGRAMYPEPRVYLETQGWLTVPGQTPGHHSEHIHTGACFPQGETWVQPNDGRSLDVKHVFHNVVGYQVTVVRAGFVDSGGSAAGGILYKADQLAELTAAANSSADTTVAVFQRYLMEPAQTNGRKEIRIGLNLIRSGPEALVDRWFTDGRWQSYINYPGLPYRDPLEDSDIIRARNWFEINGQEDYHYGGFTDSWRAKSMGVTGTTRPGVWRLHLTATHDSNHEWLHIDPSFHSHPDDLGLWWQTFRFKGSTVQPIDIPLLAAGIPSGVHKLVYLAHQVPDGVTPTKPTSTVVNVIPFKR